MSKKIWFLFAIVVGLFCITGCGSSHKVSDSIVGNTFSNKSTVTDLSGNHTVDTFIFNQDGSGTHSVKVENNSLDYEVDFTYEIDEANEKIIVSFPKVKREYYYIDENSFEDADGYKWLKE